MAVLSIVLFIIAMVFGYFILAAILKNKPTPKPLVVFHGSFAAIALLVLIAYVIAGHTHILMLTGLGLLLLAALGGFALLAIDLNNKPIPKAMALMHPVFALAGVVIVVVAIFQTLSS